MISKNKLKFYASLKEKKFREKEKRFLVEGLRLCEEILTSNYEVETILYCPAKLTTFRAKQVLKRFQEAKTSVEELDVASLKRLSVTVHSQGFIAVVKMKEYSFNCLLQAQPQMIVALDHINEPGNVGTIMRSANWFGAAAILLSQDTVEFTNPKVLRASMGSVFHLPILEKLDLKSRLLELAQKGYALFVADLEGSVIYSEADFSNKCVLILGNEITGISNEIKNLDTTTLKIPQKGRGDSLNVAVAAGIILAEMSKKTNKN